MKKIIIGLCALIVIVAATVNANTTSTSETSKENETVDAITDEQVHDILIESIRYSASDDSLKLYDIYTKENTIYVVIDSYKDQWRIDVNASNIVARKQCAHLVKKYNGLSVSSIKPSTRKFGGYTLKFLYNYPTDNKPYYKTADNEILVYDNHLDEETYWISFGHYSNDPSISLTKGWYAKLKETDLIGEDSSNTDIYNDCKEEIDALKTKGIEIESFGTIYKKNFTEPSTVTSSSDSLTTNYDPNDYVVAKEYDNYEDFWNDYDEELDEDDAQELWEYWQIH